MYIHNFLPVNIHPPFKTLGLKGNNYVRNIFPIVSTFSSLPVLCTRKSYILFSNKNLDSQVYSIADNVGLEEVPSQVYLVRRHPTPRHLPPCSRRNFRRPPAAPPLNRPAQSPTAPYPPPMGTCKQTVEERLKPLRPSIHFYVSCVNW